MATYVVVSNAGPNRDLSKGAREQAYWDDHATFIDALVESGFIILGGPFEDGGAMIVVQSDSEDSVRSALADDPWYLNGILTLTSVRRWEMFINELHRLT
jgi:uncharacterized protein YciI